MLAAVLLSLVAAATIFATRSSSEHSVAVAASGARDPGAPPIDTGAAERRAEPDTISRTATPEATEVATTVAEPPATAPPRAEETLANPASTTSSPTSRPVATKRSCRDVVYTPPSASRAQVGELCHAGSQESTKVVVLVHGGAGMVGDRHDLRAWRDVYLSHGYPTFSIDYALTAVDGSRPVYPVPEQNLKAAVQFLRRTAEGRPAKVVVHGSSSGARLGAIALTTAGVPRFVGPELWSDVPDAIDGFIGFYGYYDGQQFFPESYFGPGRGPDPEVDPIGRSRLASGPTLLFHGSADTLVPATDSEMFARRLLAAGKRVDFDVAVGEGHVFDGYGDDVLSPAGQRAAARILPWLANI